MIKLLEHTRRPDITFCRNGRILITARVARILSLRPGDTINVACLDREYLLYAVRHDNNVGRHVAQCYPTKKRSRNYCANSVELCRSMLSIAGVSTDRVSLMAGEPITRNETVYLPIITQCPL